jgi:hypothetical protein
MLRLPDNDTGEERRVHRRWVSGFFVFYGLLMILAAGIIVGNQLWNNPPHETASAEAGSKKLQSAIGAPRPMRQATKRD